MGKCELEDVWRQACEVMSPVTWVTQLGLPLRFREAIAGSWAGSSRTKMNDLVRMGAGDLSGHFFVEAAPDVCGKADKGSSFSCQGNTCTLNHCDRTPAGEAERAGEGGEPRALLVGWGNGVTGENTAWRFPTKGNIHLLRDPALLLPDTY